MFKSNRQQSESINEQDLGFLLEDLLYLRDNSEFGEKFEILLAQPEKYDKLIFRIPRNKGKADIRILVSLQDYPASKIEFLPTNDPLSNSVAHSASHSLRRIKRKVVLLDILNSITEAIKKADPQLAGKGASENSFNVFSFLCGLLFQEKEPDTNYGQRRESKPDKQPFPPEATRQPKPSIESSSNFAEPPQRSSRVYPQKLFSTPIKKVLWTKSIYQKILDHHSTHIPNEYAFLCSGYLLSDGQAYIVSYYPGEMRVSTPTYCELTDNFIEATVYDVAPKEHDLIVWGHVHPIDGPSGTDSDSFKELSKWDREISQSGDLLKRSIALLINSSSKSVLFFDVHSGKRLSHDFISERNEGKYGL